MFVCVGLFGWWLVVLLCVVGFELGWSLLLVIMLYWVSEWC